MRRSGWVVLVIALITTGCWSPFADPSDEAPPLEASALTETWGCGHGFAVSNPEQDVGLLLHLRLEDDPNMRRASRGEFDRTVRLPDPDWHTEVQRGQRLFSEWCDDVAGPPELAPVVEETWDVTGGLLTLEAGTPPQCGEGSFSASLEDLEVTPPDGEPIEVGDLELRNDGWGCFAG